MAPKPIRSVTTALRSAEFRAIGRVVLHALGVGLFVGLVACAFYALLAATERLVLEGIAGYEPLRPAGEQAFELPIAKHAYSAALVILVPALGGLGAGILAYRLAHETSGGGGDAYIQAFHRTAGTMRKRVALVKIVATCFTLGSGGSGGREGPAMQVGASVGAVFGRLIDVSARERRLLAVSGTAAALSAIFGTPLGAALFAAEVLYRDDFEGDALVPAILASVTSHAVFVLVLPGSARLFAHAPSYPFEPKYLPLYVVLAIILAVFARLFVFALLCSKRAFAWLPLPIWLRPAVGGLMLGVVAVSWISFVNPHLHLAGRGIGILGSGYGAAQGAITGDAWLPAGWSAVALLFALAVVKILATSLTLGSGGSAGDFGPSLAIGGLIGGAFGRAAQILVSPEIDPGAFALVGMGTFYGGIAHTPVSALVMVCEMAGTYDLLPALMLSSGLAFVLLRHVHLYSSQPRSRFESPAHVGEESLDVLRRLRVRDVYLAGEVVVLAATSPLRNVVSAVIQAPSWQDAFPVLDANGVLAGIVPGDVLRSATTDAHDGLIIAADVMHSPVHVSPDEDLHTALVRLLDSGLRELPVIDKGRVVGMLDEAHVTRAYHDYLNRLADAPPASSRATTSDRRSS